MKGMLAGISSNMVTKGSIDDFIGCDNDCFNPAMIHLLDRLFMGGYYEVFSRHQEKFVREFVKVAGQITDGERVVPAMYAQFDRFLGRYRG